MKGFSFVLYIMVAGIFLGSNITGERKSQNGLFSQSAGHTSITFLMGEDNETSNYFEQAGLHFSLHPEERSDVVVKSMRSLEDVIRYLNQYGSEVNPWSTINIVLHGNPDTGLRTLITDGGHVATPKRLVQTILLNNTPNIDGRFVDLTTKVNVWGCGIGKNPLINMGLDHIFRTQGGRSIDVYCSPHFVIFKARVEGGIPERINLSYWQYYFKRGYKPSNSEIDQAMSEQFPEVNYNWQEAVDNSDMAMGVFQHSYHIPVSYVRIYDNKSDRPDVSEIDDKIKWVRSQLELMEQVEDSGIPFDKFHWTVNKIIYTKENGDKVPAIKAIGMSTVMCFLREESV